MIRAIVIFAVVIVVISEARAQESCGFGFMQQQCSAEECCTGLFLMKTCSKKGKEGDRCGGRNQCGCLDGFECTNGRCVNPDSTTFEPSISTGSSSTVSPDSASTDMATGMPTIEGI